MKRDRQTKFLAIFAILLAVGGLSIGFAALSQELTLGGAAQVEASNFEVIFQNLQTGVTTGSATIDTAATLTTTTHIGDYDITLVQPGDSVSYAFQVANTGTIDAKLGSINVPTSLVCTGTGADPVAATTSATNVCANLTYTLEYATDPATISVNDTLDAGTSRDMVLTLTYGTGITAEQLPTVAVDITGLDITLNYIQK